MTLNHLVWAAELGAPTALLALQGDDPDGQLIRTTLAKHGVFPGFVHHGPEFVTSVSHVFLDASGERSIIMAPASTSAIVGGCNCALRSGGGARVCVCACVCAGTDLLCWPPCRVLCGAACVWACGRVSEQET